MSFIPDLVLGQKMTIVRGRACSNGSEGQAGCLPHNQPDHCFESTAMVRWCDGAIKFI